MTVVYVDSVFLLNGAMDYLLLLLTARLAGIPLRRRRYLLGALTGGAYAVSVFLPGLSFLASTPVKLAVGVLLALIAYGGERKLLRLTLLLFALSCAMAGCVLALGLLAGGGVPMVNGIFYTDVDGTVLLVAAAGAYLLGNVVFRATARCALEGRLLPVRISVGGRTAVLTALWDSGNTVRDPSDGRPVLVTAPGAPESVLPPGVRRLCTPEHLRAPADLLEPVLLAAPGLRPRLLPFHAVGVSGGLLLTVQTDWTEIGGVRYDGLRLALSPTELGNGYTALWGGDVRKGGWHERTGRCMAASADSAGTAAG
ncbi:sigma-E processing peptidase SpoIIGA [Oscillibacter sp.]|uniref:sigma-E processing peptidase SpoIIGA n=1 Tax=Oscillibacter sp. TaxID=1945593 RepID=UPI00261FDF11|nr:sigma-E processing peptidase SpoIIGA [Oscillibacter sp.]MDD3347552.1 sigma-E processing peptidase SpoIIGA [Oscillibacter sp.]